MALSIREFIEALAASLGPATEALAGALGRITIAEILAATRRRERDRFAEIARRRRVAAPRRP